MNDQAEAVVDARGLRCPLPVIRIAALARAAQAGALVTVLWTDPAAGHDLPAWARMRGHDLIATVELPPDDEGGEVATVSERAYATTVRVRRP